MTPARRGEDIYPLLVIAVFTAGESFAEAAIFDEGIFGCDQVVAVADTGQDHGSCYFHDPAGAPPVVVPDQL